MRPALVLLAITLAACSGGGQDGATPSTVAGGTTVSDNGTRERDQASPRPHGADLVPTDAGFRNGCRRAAVTLGFAVPCATALPITSAPVRCEVPPAFSGAEVEPKEGCALGEGFLLEPSGFESPAVSHLVIEGSRGGFQADCGERDPHERVTVRGHQALLIDCPETGGLHAGHVLLRWKEERTFVIVSLHGHTDLNRQLVQEIGAGIEILGPHDVELVRAPAVVARQCRLTATRLGYPIPSPRRLPEGSRPTAVVDPGLIGLAFADDYVRPGFRGYRRWAFLTVEFPSETREGHFVISVSPRIVDPLHFMSLRPSPRDRLDLAGQVRRPNGKAQVVRVLTSEGSIFQRHTVLLWSEGGHIYGVGFHGLDEEARRLNLRVARSIRLVAPWEAS